MTTKTNTRQLIGDWDSSGLVGRSAWAYALEELIATWGEEIEIATDTLRGLRTEVERLEWLAPALQTLERNFEHHATIVWGMDTEPVPDFWEGQVLSQEILTVNVLAGVAADRRLHEAALAVYTKAAEEIEKILADNN